LSLEQLIFGIGRSRHQQSYLYFTLSGVALEVWHLSDNVCLGWVASSLNAAQPKQTLSDKYQTLV
jgi:hypothetical protein